jgi:hypothetical protein
MRQPYVRLLALMLGVGSLLLAGAPSTYAETAATSSGTLTIASEPGDWVGQGQQFAFATPGDVMTVGGSPHGFGIDVADGAGLPDWSLRFEMPLGQTLAPGTYGDAQMVADESHPGIRIEGEHRGCGSQTGGRFTVLAAELGPYGYLLHVHATFEQYCDGATAALRGEVDAYAPTPATPVETHVTVDDTAMLDRGDGRVTLSGTIRCSTLIVAHAFVSVTQQTKKGPASASPVDLYIPECSTAPQPWRATLVSSTPVRYAPGTLEATADAQVQDEWYSAWSQNQPVIYATDHVQRLVTLKPGT